MVLFCRCGEPVNVKTALRGMRFVPVFHRYDEYAAGPPIDDCPWCGRPLRLETLLWHHSSTGEPRAFSPSACLVRQTASGQFEEAE
jgi:diadenosine tetraphosphatase ApaH/serine/threonine PP2A family protein phosphatase